MAESTMHTQHNHAFALQKYLVLEEQHEFLHQHLEELYLSHSSLQVFNITGSSTPAKSPTRMSSSSSEASSGTVSPNSVHSRSSSLNRGYGHSRCRSSMPKAAPAAPALETVLDETTLSEVAADEAKLIQVNEGIKRELTELLNCEAVRCDRALRTWVQSRLMDTERELRNRRRRRSAPDS